MHPSKALNRAMQPPTQVYEVRPRKDKRGVDLISDMPALRASSRSPMPLA
jgi:hypothetical protein